MTVTLNANTSTGFIATSDTSGVLQLQTGGTTALAVSAAQVVTLTNPLPVASGGSGGTTSTGTGANVLGTTPSFTSTIGVGGATASASGAGITFPSTDLHYSTNANTLDDYEEGTWTPTIAFGGASAGVTYAASTNGRYTKIGRIVTVAFYIELTNKGSSTGNLTIKTTPLTPYNAGGANPYYAGEFVGEGSLSSMPTGTYILGWSDGNFYVRYNGTGGFAAITNSNINNNSTFYGTITYEVA